MRDSEPGTRTINTLRTSGGFVTTHWTRVLAARGKSAEAQSALNHLCETYYAPVVVFLRCSGFDEDRARDLAHDFFARLLERGGIDHVERGRARFRSYLLGALKHFLSGVQSHDLAAKRGGSSEHVSLAPGTDTSPGCEPVDARNRTPEDEFDREWAISLLGGALRRMAVEYAAPGEAARFEALRPWLTGDVQGLSQAEVAEKLGMNEGAVKVAIHRLRKRFREVVKSEIAETLSDPAQVKEELRSLMAALR